VHAIRPSKTSTIALTASAAAFAALVAAQPALANSGEAPASRLGSAWEPAPLVLFGAGVVLVLFAQAFFRLRRRGRGDHASWPRVPLFFLAVGIGTLALVSPLDPVGDSYLLSGHMLQHVLIGDAAPGLALVALRGPLAFFLLPQFVLKPLARSRRLRGLLALVLRPPVSLTAWLVAIAAWHVPAAYDYTLRHQTVHDLEHLSFIFVGLLVWMQLIDPARRQQLQLTQRLGYMLVLFGAAAVLAGVLIFSSTALYPAYADQGERLLGLSPFRDQQLAGLVMVAEQLVSLGVCGAFLLRARTTPARLRAVWIRERGAAAAFAGAVAERARSVALLSMQSTGWSGSRSV
jgi:putative membrane protein